MNALLAANEELELAQRKEHAVICAGGAIDNFVRGLQMLTYGQFRRRPGLRRYPERGDLWYEISGCMYGEGLGP